MGDFPLWIAIVIITIPMILGIYGLRLFMDKAYDMKPIICHNCGKAVTKNISNNNASIVCPHCSTSI